jgi:hypothetical protein
LRPLDERCPSLAANPLTAPIARPDPVSKSWLLVGATLAVAVLVQPVLAFLVDPHWAAGLGAAMAAELVTGREAAIPLAVAAGVPPAWIAVTSILQNIALAALVVPAAASGAHAVETRPGFWGRLMHSLHGGASRQLHQGRSAWVLFGFMLLPFVANGAVIAGVIGVLAGIEVRRLVLVILAAVIITAAAWSFAYAGLASFLSSVHPALALLPAVITCAVILAWGLAAMVRAHRGAEA